MRKYSVGIAAIASLILSTLAPMPASAVVAAPSSSFSPASSSTVAVGDGVQVSTTLPLPTDTTLDGVMQQTWDDGRVSLGSVTAPTGWNVEYKTDGTWASGAPQDATSVSGVRASATSLVTGPGSADGLQTTATANSQVIVADASNVASAGRGDGWDVILTPKYVVNVYHHNYSDYELECHVRATGDLCGDLYTVANVQTSNGSGGTYYGGKVFSYVVANGAASVICTNVTSLPFTSCGITAISAGVSSATGNLGTQVFDGTKIWSAETANGKLLCFNVTTSTSCGATTLPSITQSGRSIPAFTAYIGGRVYISTNVISCIEPSTGLACAGTWPVATPNGDSDSNVIPRMVAGAIAGVCTFAGDIQCFDLTGASVDTPTGFAAITAATATRLSAGNGYFETDAFIGNKVYWASHPSGSPWDNSTATCYDWSIDALCAGFDSTVVIGQSRYALRIDKNNAACIWTNGDNGVITNFNAVTGEIGCPITTTKAAVDFDALPRYSCSAITGMVRTFSSITFAGPVGFDITTLRVSVINGSGNVVTGFESMTPSVTGLINLSTLQVVDTSSSFRFILEATGLTAEQAALFTSTLAYTVDPVQLCVTLVQVQAICPVSIEGLTSVPQANFAVTATASFSVAGSVVQTNTASATYAVEDLEPVTCYNWLGFRDSSGNGVDTLGDDSQVTSIVFGPDGRMYAGGVFEDAGGDTAADNLAVWDGTDWAAVGPVSGTDGNNEPTRSTAISSRVADLIFTDAGELIVTGHFENAGGVDEADYVAIYNFDTNTWRATGLTLNNSGRALTIDGNGTVFVAGTFSGKVKAFNPADATAAISIATLNSNTLALSTSPSGQVYAGGQFSNYARKYDAVNNEWVDVSEAQDRSTYLDDYVTDIAFDGTKVYFVGLYRGVSVLDTATDTFSWLGGSQATNDDARGVAVDANHNVYVAGQFSAAGDTSASRATYFDGTNWHSFVDGSTGSNSMSDDDNWGDWDGAWEVTISPSGIAIFGGDFNNVANKNGIDHIAYFAPSELVLSPASLVRPITEVIYRGPVIQNYSHKKVEKGTEVKVDGKRLTGLARAFVNGKECVVTKMADNTFTVTMPEGVEPGTYDLVLHGTFGVLIDKDVLTFGRSSVAATRVNLSKEFIGFAADSPVLTNDLKKRIAAFVKTATSQTKMVCIGSTSNKVVTAFDKALATKRANVTCNYAKSLKADLVTSIKITPSSAMGPKARKSTILLTH